MKKTYLIIMTGITIFCILLGSALHLGIGVFAESNPIGRAFRSVLTLEEEDG